MLSEIVVAAGSGIGFVQANGEWLKAEPNCHHGWQKCNAQEVQNTLTLGSDTTYRRAKLSDSLDSVFDEIALGLAKNRSFTFLLAGLDPENDPILRLEALKAAERRFQNDPSLVQNAEERLFSAPVPTCLELKAALELAKKSELNHVFKILQFLDSNRKLIFKIGECWVLAGKSTRSHETQQALWEQLTQSGYFKKLTLSIVSCDIKTGLRHAILKATPPKVTSDKQMLAEWEACLSSFHAELMVGIEVKKDKKAGSNNALIRKRIWGFEGKVVGFVGKGRISISQQRSLDPRIINSQIRLLINKGILTQYYGKSAYISDLKGWEIYSQAKPKAAMAIRKCIRIVNVHQPFEANEPSSPYSNENLERFPENMEPSGKYPALARKKYRLLITRP